jgi:hypothetical protein
MLEAGPHPREEVRLGCAAGDEDACVLAGQLFGLFSKSGWSVRGDRVERVQLSIPLGGVVLMKRGATTDPPPKGSGVWVQMTPSLTTLQVAFRNIGYSVETRADASMPEGVIGVFVGPIK